MQTKLEPINISPPLRNPLRGKIYAALQGLRGYPLGRFLRLLKTWEGLPTTEFERLRAERLRWLLTHASKRVPLYRREPWASALAGRELELAAWPVLEREHFRAHWDEARARPPPGPRITRKTSGTSGQPMKMVFTPNSDAWGWAHRYRGLGWHGIPIGERSLRLSQDRRPLRDLLLGQRIVPALDSPAAIDEAVRILSGRQSPLVTGPPSALFRLARCLRERGVGRPLVSFARVGGEQLFPFQRIEIEKYLARRAIDSYGCNEIGAIAGECPAGAMHIYSDHLYLEIFNGNTPARVGEFGDIVLTALHNPAMPLIRYRVGDRGRLAADPCRCGLPLPVLAEIQARTADVFRAADGTEHHGSELVNDLAAFFADPLSDGIRQIQFVRTNTLGWRVLIEGREPVARAALTDRLVGMVRQVAGADCRAEYENVLRIPRERGKFRYYRLE
ncbi:MAG TPA: hypothetical protein VGA24_01010 [Steroidobacteraceae bacterium]